LKLYGKYLKIWYCAIRIVDIKQKLLIYNRFRTINIENGELHNKATTVKRNCDAAASAQTA